MSAQTKIKSWKRRVRIQHISKNSGKLQSKYMKRRAGVCSFCFIKEEKMFELQLQNWVSNLFLSYWQRLLISPAGHYEPQVKTVGVLGILVHSSCHPPMVRDYHLDILFFY